MTKSRRYSSSTSTSTSSSSTFSRSIRRPSNKNKNKNKYLESNMVAMFLQMLNTTKLYHWKTKSFAQHKATDELYSNLNSTIDKYV